MEFAELVDALESLPHLCQMEAHTEDGGEYSVTFFEGADGMSSVYELRDRQGVRSEYGEGNVHGLANAMLSISTEWGLF